jgi:glycosyltransferase involved in cell wall biosynthesis
MEETIARVREKERFCEKTYFINIQNKSGIGGVERIVADFSEELSSSQIPNLVFNLGRNKVTRKLLSNSIGRKFLIFGRLLELLVIVILRKITHRKEDVVLVFFHSECHLLYSLASSIINFLPRVTSVIYLCQSIEIYPQKLLRRCLFAISKSDLTICYSTLVAEKWQIKTNKEIHSLHNPVRLDRIKIRDLQPRSDLMELIHIGRPVSYKAPEKSLEFAIKVSKSCNRVRLTFVGIDALDMPGEIQLPKNLEVVFLGIIKDTLTPTCAATALLNLVDFNKSSEVIGVAAIESLCLGVPVVIRNKNQTGYSDLPGLITEEIFLKKIALQTGNSPDWSGIFALSKEQIKDVRNKVSSNNFLREFQNLLRLTD